VTVGPTVVAAAGRQSAAQNPDLPRVTAQSAGPGRSPWTEPTTDRGRAARPNRGQTARVPRPCVRREASEEIIVQVFCVENESWK
jgi:hypothetical protein